MAERQDRDSEAYNKGLTGCGAVVARLVRDQEVVGSNPTTPTIPNTS